MKKYGFLAVFILLLIPVFWLLFLKETKFVGSKLPVYGERYFDSSIGDTVFHTISDFAFIDQHGDTVTQEDFNDCIYVANFFFARCEDICPPMMQNLRLVYHKFKDAPNVKFISHTVDPQNDSVEVLANYAESLGARPGKWYLVTGSKASLYYSGEFDYLLATVETSIEDAFIHSEQLVLVDKERRIRGFYDGTDYKKVKDLQEDIKALLGEYRNAEHIK